MSVMDWRDVGVDVLQPLYAAEHKRWSLELTWDMSPSIDIIEEGRRAGHVPGFVALDPDGRAVGWTFFVLHDGVLQVGGLSAERPSTARKLLDLVLRSPESRLARQLSCFLLADSRGVLSALARQRFVLHDTLYLSRGTAGLGDDPSPSSRVVRQWREQDLPSTVRLLASAYEDAPSAQIFAPDGRRDQWAHYAGQLVRTPACGRFDPALSFVQTSEAGQELDAAVLTTRISSETAHVAQVAVAPQARRQRLGERLVCRAIRAAAAEGLPRVTLMVDARNAAALGLYARLGFQEGARFVYGHRLARTRLAA